MKEKNIETIVKKEEADKYVQEVHSIYKIKNTYDVGVDKKDYDIDRRYLCGGFC